MARSNRRVSKLAQRAGLTAELALERLQDVGVQVSKANDHIDPRKLPLAEATLGLITLRPKPEPKTIQPPQVTVQQKRVAKIVDTGTSSKAPQTDKPKNKQLSERDAPRPIGRVQSLKAISVGDAIRFHNQLVENYRHSQDPIDPPGVRSIELLESAMERSQTGFGERRKYPTPQMAAAAMLHSMINNHPFHNGNKRTALASALVFIDRNRWRLKAGKDELFKFMLDIASHQLIEGFDAENKPDSDREVRAIAHWLAQRMERIKSRTIRLKWHVLQRLLTAQGCTIENSKRGGNRITIDRRNDDGRIYRCKISRRNDGSEIDIATIQKIRNDLRLTSENGIDDDAFYDAEEQLPDFVIYYRKSLDLLAKT